MGTERAEFGVGDDGWEERKSARENSASLVEEHRKSKVRAVYRQIEKNRPRNLWKT